MLGIKQRTLRLMISLFTISKESLTLPQNFSKACPTRQDFSNESTASALMSGDVLVIETMCRIQSSPKRHFNHLGLYLE